MRLSLSRAARSRLARSRFARSRFVRSRLAVAVLLMLFARNGAPVAETATTGQVPGGTLVPRDVYVGDAAVLTFEVTLTGKALGDGNSLEIDTGLLAPSRDVTVRQVTVTGRAGKAEVRILFVPWVSGPLRLPAIPVGKETVSPPAPVIASLLRDPATGLQDPRSPVLVPGTTWILYGFLACAIAFLLLASFLLSRLRRYAAADPSARNAARRKREFLRDLAALSRRTVKLSQVEWYALFSATLRRYVGLYALSNARTARALTGSELSAIAERRRAEAGAGEALSGNGAAPHDSGDAAHGAAVAEGAGDPGAGGAVRTDALDAARRAGGIVRALFDAADRVRFSGRDCADGRARDVELARELCRVLEEDDRHALS